MSFSSDVKAELCQDRLEKKSLAIAEAYGVLLYCNTFSKNEIRIITSSEEFSQRLPRLFHKAFGMEFDVVPNENAVGKRTYQMLDTDKILKIFSTFGIESDTALSLHINLGVLDDDNCRVAFVRGAFLAGGSITDPAKGYHLEMFTSHMYVNRELYALLSDIGFSPKDSSRSGGYLVYFKRSSEIEDFFTTIGASGAAMEIMNAKIEKDMSNTINRKVNCDSANADKTVEAAQLQLDAIRRLDKLFGLDSLPDKLQEAAFLRIANPEASLADLARLAMPEVSKSCMNHRLKKLMSLEITEMTGKDDE